MGLVSELAQNAQLVVTDCLPVHFPNEPIAIVTQLPWPIDASVLLKQYPLKEEALWLSMWLESNYFAPLAAKLSTVNPTEAQTLAECSLYALFDVDPLMLSTKIDNFMRMRPMPKTSIWINSAVVRASGNRRYSYPDVALNW